MINFPLWVGAPTPCKTRTQRLVLPYPITGRHGAEIREGIFRTESELTIERQANGKLMAVWKNGPAGPYFVRLNKIR